MAKLVLPEPEREALESRLRDSPRRITSELTIAEAARAVRRSVERRGGAAGRALETLDRVLAGLESVPLDRSLLRVAGRLDPATLRSLDAVHLASAITAPGPEGLFVSYDRRQLEAARAAGLAVESPGAG